MALFVFVCVFVVVASVTHASGSHAQWREEQLAKVPDMALLHAPFTPFHNDTNRSLNLDVLDKMAATAAQFGVTVVWTCGGMGEFYTLTVDERKQINQAWVQHGHANNLYVIAHVGTTVLQDAIDMAAHAKSIGADAVASVPPYYEQPGSIDELIAFLKPIAAAAHPLPLYYYHIPGSTHYSINALDLLDAASTQLPELLGIKFVSSDTLDWYNIVQKYNSSHVLMFAPEPKLQSFALGLGRGTVLAEDFFAPTYIRMQRHYALNNHGAAQQEQAWKYKAMSVFGENGGGLAEREVYKHINGVDLGPRRRPTGTFDPNNFKPLIQGLDSIGFFNQTW
ncbi:hypothetical protein PTSG_03075 [Salpingoeca rosetta]|uniref:N-acetylneuraminate lyase n=1 Tax=Salpingoeca rosetta (strain ATCC 50818 / BSB-021) TaxID=946362 RepID=F2U464_SALR5|nr:uncharacterized protein PTSG_03075 [Salpingoeca rosetta]EGD82430.1 hypothetical protein PTSG_03075 [Salpingoeca rosetta]|eukprot:XP_004995666.1 hypothetical protein PTSG_03075 [Salpingoeca rosetta]